MARANSERRNASPRLSSSRFAKPLATRQITPGEVQARLSFRLRRIIGRGKRISLRDAARLTGINARTLKAYVEGTACPNVARYGRLLRVLGPEVGIELALMLGWQPRAANPLLPHTEDLRALRDTIAATLQAIDHVRANAETGKPSARSR